jgi:hypothetical protein
MKVSKDTELDKLEEHLKTKGYKMKVPAKKGLGYIRGEKKCSTQ